MKEYFFHKNKKTNLEFHSLYEVESNKAHKLYFTEKIENFKITQHIKTDESRNIEISNTENLLDAIYKKDRLFKEHKILKKLDIVLKAINEPGIYSPRIYRPLIHSDRMYITNEKKIQNQTGKYFQLNPLDKEIMISSINQLTILTDELNLIFKTIQPTKENYKTYGHNIRNLLILACTEVEAQLKGIIKSNTTATKNSYNTKDYFKLKKVLKLADYKVSFNYYPSIDLCSPFKTWKEDNPTKSLKWYDSYNAVKHDREGSFHRANLLDTINAVSALSILIIAQYGYKIPYWNERIGNYYNFENFPEWNLLEHYIPPIESTDWKVRKLNL